LDHKEPLAHKVHRVSQENQETQVLMVNKEALVNQEMQEPKDKR